jgi:pimeloyl-ACP methyl ester carboxylesterase
MPEAISVTRVVGLRDGRRLAYSETGRAGGEPVLYLHGAIGTPYRRSPELDAAIAELGIRYLMVSRPGYGASDPLRGRSLLDHAGDVEQLADALGLGRFAVVGVSTGAPYALACARALPDRVRVAAAVSSLSPVGLDGGVRVCLSRALRLSGGVPLRLRLALGLLSRAPRTCARGGDSVVRLLERHPGLLLRAMVTGAPDADRSLLDDPEASRTAAMSFLAAARGGVGEMIDDYRLCTAAWGFDPREISTRVHVWHGRRDQLVPVGHAFALAEAIPHSRLRLDPEDGHFFFRRRIREILGGLVDRSEVLGQERAGGERVREDLHLGGHVLLDEGDVGLAERRVAAVELPVEGV